MRWTDRAGGVAAWAAGQAIRGMLPRGSGLWSMAGAVAAVSPPAPAPDAGADGFDPACRDGTPPTRQSSPCSMPQVRSSHVGSQGAQAISVHAWLLPQLSA